MATEQARAVPDPRRPARRRKALRRYSAGNTRRAPSLRRPRALLTPECFDDHRPDLLARTSCTDPVLDDAGVVIEARRRGGSVSAPSICSGEGGVEDDDAADLDVELRGGDAHGRPMPGAAPGVALSQPGRQHVEDLGEVGLGVEPVQLARRDERGEADDCGAGVVVGRRRARRGHPEAIPLKARSEWFGPGVGSHRRESGAGRSCRTA